MKGLILFSAVVLGFAYVKAQESLATMALMGGLPGLFGGGKGGAGKMDTLTTMALMNQGGGGSNNMMQMMAMMNLLGGSNSASSSSSTGASASPMNPFMQMNLCRRSDAAANGDARFCTDITCKLESLKRHGTPNLLKCVPMMGCCFADTKSMMLAMMLK